MDLNILRTMQAILSNYSRQPARKLVDHYLNIRLILRVSTAQTSQLLSHLELLPQEKAVFGSWKKPLLCIVIDHPLDLPLSPGILEQVEGCIVFGPDGQDNNILGANSAEGGRRSRGIAFRYSHCDFQTFKDLMDAYLSVCEVFLGHLHLVVSCVEADQSPNFIS